jgi:hypothetical protein
MELLSMIDAILIAAVLFAPAFVAIWRVMARYRQGELTRSEMRLWMVIVVLTPIIGTIVYLISDLGGSKRKRKILEYQR